MDNIFLQVLEEIAVAGPDGILLGNLWASLGITDIYMKQFIWLKLLDIPNITLHWLGEPQRPVTSSEQYDEHFVKITAAPVLHRPALGILDPSITLTPPQIQLMRNIATCKDAGVLQSELSKAIQTDARTVFYHLRQPIDCGLIVRKNIPDRNTNILCLNKWARFGASAGFFEMHMMEGESMLLGKDGEEGSGVNMDSLGRAVCSVLQTSGEQEVADERIRRALRLQPMLWLTLKRHLVRMGHLGQTRVRDQTSGILVSGVRLLRPMDEEQRGTVVVELPLLYQLYGSIAAAGPKGIRQSDLVRLCYNPPRHVASAIQQLCAHFGVVALRENTGRLSSFRLYCREFFPEPGMTVMGPDSDQMLGMGGDRMGEEEERIMREHGMMGEGDGMMDMLGAGMEDLTEGEGGRAAVSDDLMLGESHPMSSFPSQKRG